MSAVREIDMVEMLEKHGFSREEAKMFIDFGQGRVATKEDLNVLNANINTRFVELEANFKEEMQKQNSVIEKKITRLETNINWLMILTTGILMGILTQIVLALMKIT